MSDDIPVPLSVYTREISERDVHIGSLENQLTSCQEKCKKYHTTLMLRYKLEKIEKMSKPPEMSVDDWDNTSRLEKWKIIFNTNEEYIFYEFVVCVKGIFNDATVFARKMKLLYSILNNRIHEYIETGDISETAFREDIFNSVAECLDNTTVS